MNLKEFENFLISKEHIYPDYCVKENIIYNNSEIFSPEFNGKYIGLPIFYMINEKDSIVRCNLQQVYEIMNLLEKKTYED